MACQAENKIERGFLGKQKWNYMVLDEGQSIKNANSARYERCATSAEYTHNIYESAGTETDLNRETHANRVFCLFAG